MTPEQWNQHLEAYLANELTPDQRAAFEAAVAADPALAAELEARRAFGAAARGALGADLPSDLEDLATGALRAGRQSSLRRFPRRWAMLAAAAVLAVAVLAPVLLRNLDGAVGRRSTNLRSGQVVAVRFGEQPGRAVHLEAGCFDQNQGVCR
jgi:anti-sigma factor RsiW